MPLLLLLPLPAVILLCGWCAGLPQRGIPEDIPAWVFFFGLPHIVSSLQTCCDADYLRAYRRHVPVCLALLCLPWIFVRTGLPQSMLLGAVGLWTVQHVVAQQVGIGLAAAQQRPSRLSGWWQRGVIAVGSLGFMRHYAAGLLAGPLPPAAERLVIIVLASLLAGGVLLVARARQRGRGVWVLGMNLALLLIAAGFTLFGTWPLVGLVLARVLHDVTGFVVYVSHDCARNRMARANPLYRVAGALPVAFLNVGWSLVIAACLTLLSRISADVGWLVVGVTLVHYYLEGRIWRGDTPHRRHLSFRETSSSRGSG